MRVRKFHIRVWLKDSRCGKGRLWVQNVGKHFSQLGAVWLHPDSHPKATDHQTSRVFPSDRQGDTTFCRHLWNSSLFVFCFSESRWKFNEHIFHLVFQLLVIIICTLNFQFEFCILSRAAVSPWHCLDSDKTRKNLRFHYACCKFFGD